MLVKCYSHKQSTARTVKINSSIHSCWQWNPAKLNSSKTFNLDCCGTTLFSSPAYNCKTSSLPGNSQLHYVCPAFIFLWTNTSFKIQTTSKSSLRALRAFFVLLCLFARVWLCEGCWFSITEDALWNTVYSIVMSYKIQKGPNKQLVIVSLSFFSSLPMRHPY